MSYSTSRSAVFEMVDYLKLLDKRTSVKFSTSEPVRLAYRLRQAFFAARFYKDFDEYADLQNYYVVETRVGCVIARHLEYPKGVPRSEVHAEIISEHPEAHMDRLGEAVDEVLSSTSVPRAASLDEVIGAMVKYGRAVEEIYFPDAKLKVEDMTRLHRWVVANEWQLINNEDEGVTITQREIPPEIVWRPPNG